ncbi:hypothetical protein [Catenuloplanes japonicus]|uniref:hypothetical protein n=1 Tax=Catenuloplanes japonicus TaxID=33876 RepID=UPI00068F5EF7|nr:hypothetical protein [Catenuloplanes japonicus]
MKIQSNAVTRGFVSRFNGCVLSLYASPRLGRLVRRRLTVLTYTGPRSGRTFSFPVGYRRTGDTVRIDVMMPDTKGWWRAFLGAGGPLTLRLDGTEVPGHAVAHRASPDRVVVTVTTTR